MNTKYELVKDDNVNYEGTVLYRIRALRDFGDVKKGDLGGYMCESSMLDDASDSWIYEGSRVVNSIVYDSSVNNSSVIKSSVDDSSVNNSSVIKSSVYNSIVYDSSVDDSRVYNSSVNNSSVDDSRVDDSSVIKSSVNNSIVYNSSVDDSRVDNSSVDDETVKKDTKSLKTCKWKITITDNHINVGCKQKTPEQWLEWLDGTEEFETKRGTKTFQAIEKAIRFAVDVFKAG